MKIGTQVLKAYRHIFFKAFCGFFVFILLMLLCPSAAQCAELTLEWTANTEEDLDGYYIYYGTTSGIYTHVVDVGNVTEYTFTDLIAGMTYYFVAAAYDTSLNESAYTAEIMYTITNSSSNGGNSSSDTAGGLSCFISTVTYQKLTNASDGLPNASSSLCLPNILLLLVLMLSAGLWVQFKSARYILCVCMLLTCFASTGQANGIEVLDRYNPQVLKPPDYYSFTPPAVGDDYVDPVFGSHVRRLTNENSRLVHVGQSEYTNFNADDSLFFSSISAGVYVYDAETGVQVNQFPTINIANVRWSPIDKDHFFYMTGSQIRKYNVNTGLYTLLHDFGSAISDCGGDGNQISDNGRFWLINQGNEIFVYDLVNDQIYPQTNLGQLGFGCKSEGCIDFASISPTGNYILVNWYPVSDLPREHYGIEVYDKNWNFISRNYPFNSHHSVGIIDGEEWIVAPAQFNSTPGALDFNNEWGCSPGDLVAVKISAPDLKILMPMSVWTYFETGAYKGTRDKYVYVAAEERGYDPTDSCDYCCATCGYNNYGEKCGWFPYFGEIIEVPLDLSKPIRRLVHHRAFAPNCLTHEYKNQPDFFVSHQGDKIVFQSNNGAEQPDAYMMWVTAREGDGQGDTTPPASPRNFRVRQY